MINTTFRKLNTLKKKFYNKKVAVVGDMMLDCYFWGVVNRISPEAPVPVVEVDKEFARFGGAMNVAHNIYTLGGLPLPIGVIGNDVDGKLLRNLMKKSGLKDNGIFIDSS